VVQIQETSWFRWNDAKMAKIEFELSPYVECYIRIECSAALARDLIDADIDIFTTVTEALNTELERVQSSKETPIYTVNTKGKVNKVES